MKEEINIKSKLGNELVEVLRSCMECKERICELKTIIKKQWDYCIENDTLSDEMKELVNLEIDLFMCMITLLKGSDVFYETALSLLFSVEEYNKANPQFENLGRAIQYIKSIKEKE